MCLSCFNLFAAKAAKKERPSASLNESQKEQIAKATPTKLRVEVQKARNILVFSHTASYNHAQAILSFEHYLKTLKENIGDSYNFVISNDFSNFEKDKLATFDAVVLSNTTGRIFTAPKATYAKMSKQEKEKLDAKHEELLDNLMEYVENGGGLLGIHGACDSNKDSDIFSEMIGGRFINHPWACGAQKAVIIVEETKHPLVEGIWEGGEFISEDELYQVTYGYDRAKQRVLCSIDFDRSPIVGDKSSKVKQIHREDGDFGLVWLKDYGKGRVAYVAFGHDVRAFVIPENLELYTRGIQYVSGDLKADATPKAKSLK